MTGQLFAQAAGDQRSIEDQVPSVDRAASQEARDELTLARNALAKAQANSMSMVRVAEIQFKNTDGYKSAQIEFQMARSRFYAMQKPVLDALREDEEYAKLNNDRDSARLTIDRLVESQKADYIALLPLAKQAMEAKRRMTRAEVIALALDPEVETARQELMEANTRLRSMNANARRSAVGSQMVKIAGADLTSARVRVEEANRLLADSLTQEAEADRIRDLRIQSLRNGQQLVLPDEAVVKPAKPAKPQNKPKGANEADKGNDDQDD